MQAFTVQTAESVINISYNGGHIQQCSYKAKCLREFSFQVVEDMEAELKTVEKNVLKIRTILSSMDDSNMSLTEHLHDRQVQQCN